MKYIFASILVLGLVGCGNSQDGNVTLDQEATAKAWSATDEVLRDGAEEAIHALIQDSDSRSYTFDCPGGGTVQFDADSGYSADLLLGANIEFDFKVEFDQCVKAGLTIDGEMDYEKSASLNMLGARSELDWEGEIEWSGWATGSCDVDVESEAALSPTLLGTGVNGSFEYEGEICGFDAELELNFNF
jgi:hypothetical protein